jgi:hypothetical protein
MEASGGEPDVIGYDEDAGQYIFCDCSAESPAGRSPTTRREAFAACFGCDRAPRACAATHTGSAAESLFSALRLRRQPNPASGRAGPQYHADPASHRAFDRLS